MTQIFYVFRNHMRSAIKLLAYHNTTKSSNLEKGGKGRQ